MCLGRLRLLQTATEAGQRVVRSVYVLFVAVPLSRVARYYGSSPVFEEKQMLTRLPTSMRTELGS